MPTAYVSIGRNVNGKPMSDEYWRNFREEVLTLVGDRQTYFVGTGSGDSREWGSEESFTAAFEIDPGEFAGGVVPVRERLAYLAARYGQDAIALAVAEVEFVSAEVAATA